MTDRELLYVKTIIEENSITKAAAKLYIAQPSLSQAVQKIEASLGVHLFERTSRGLQPTQYGMKYYEAASHILRVYHGLLEEIEEEEDAQRQLMLGTTTLLSNLLLGDICPAFWKEHPRVKIHFWENSVSEILQKLNDGEIYMAVLHMEQADSVEDFSCDLIQRDEPVLIMNADRHPFRSKIYRENGDFEEIDPQELKEYPYIRYEDGSGYCKFVEKCFRREGIRYSDNIMLTTNSAYTAIRIACSAKGYTFCPQSCVPSYVPSKYIYHLPYSFSLNFDIYAVSFDHSRERNAESIFMKFLKSNLKP